MNARGALLSEPDPSNAVNDDLAVCLPVGDFDEAGIAGVKSKFAHWNKREWRGFSALVNRKPYVPIGVFDENRDVGRLLLCGTKAQTNLIATGGGKGGLEPDSRRSFFTFTDHIDMNTRAEKDVGAAKRETGDV